MSRHHSARTRLLLTVLSSAASPACFDDGIDQALPSPTVPGPPPPTQQPAPFPDARVLPPLRAPASPPPPVSGGTLHVGPSVVVAAESDRDRIQVVTIASADGRLALTSTLELRAGDEPGRVVEADGAYFVVLRRGGAIARIDGDPDGGGWSVSERFPVCASPRGIDFDGEALWVACLRGRLIRLDPSDGRVLFEERLPADLRDVVVTEEAVFVSRFRSAEVLVLHPDGTLLRTVRLGRGGSRGRLGRSVPNVAYRMVEAGPKSVLLVHQVSATSEAIDIRGSNGYGGADAAGFCVAPLVQAGHSIVEASGATQTFLQGALVLPVDVALSPGGRHFEAVIAQYGRKDDQAPPPGTGPTAGDVALVTSTRQGGAPAGCNPQRLWSDEDDRRVLAVGFTASGLVVRQTVHPHRIEIEDGRAIGLPGPDTYDTGHDLFFGDAGGGIACASCHAEGGDDGLVWVFEGLGPRRTQELRGGILDTAPFHWIGDMRDLDELSHEVMGRRMGGPNLPPDWVDALGRWMDALPLPPRDAPDDPASVARGRAIFESGEAGCTGCHFDDRLGSNGAHDVGTGIVAHVPGLAGLAIRAPYMHDGCAETILDRFDAACGGSRHGSVAHLDEAQLTDLVAFLRSL